MHEINIYDGCRVNNYYFHENKKKSCQHLRTREIVYQLNVI